MTKHKNNRNITKHKNNRNMTKLKNNRNMTKHKLPRTQLRTLHTNQIIANKHEHSNTSMFLRRLDMYSNAEAGPFFFFELRLRLLLIGGTRSAAKRGEFSVLLFHEFSEACACACMYIYIYMYICICMYACMYVYMHAYMQDICVHACSLTGFCELLRIKSS